MSDAEIRQAERSIFRRVLVDRSVTLRALVVGCAALIPLVIVGFATGSLLLGCLAYSLVAGGTEAALVMGRRRYWRVESMLMWLAQVDTRLQARQAARRASPDTASAGEREFDLIRAAVYDRDKPGDPDIAALHDAASMLSDEERSYELVVLGLILAIVADRRGYDFMPYLVQAADEASDIRLSPRRQVVLWYVRWRTVIGLGLVGLLIALLAAMAGQLT